MEYIHIYYVYICPLCKTVVGFSPHFYINDEEACYYFEEHNCWWGTLMSLVVKRGLGNFTDLQTLVKDSVTAKID